MSNKTDKQGLLKRLIYHILPPDKWKFPVIILLGIFIGLALTVLKISNAVSYLSDDPKACVNCHIMSPQYATWERGSHGRVTVCNDCHVPQDNFVNKYYFKAKDGLRHATMFTFRLEPQVIQIKEAGKKAVQENCIRCHTDLIHPVSVRAISNKMIINKEETYCWDCHRETPHGRVNSLSSAPYALVPKLTPILPDWLRSSIEKEKKQ